MAGERRAGIWADDPDIRAFRQVVEDLQARRPSLAPKGHRYGVGLTGSRYYADLAVWQADPRPDIAAFRALVTELQQRQQAETEERFVVRLRAKLVEVAALSVADRRQAIGISDELLEASRVEACWDPMHGNALQGGSFGHGDDVPDRGGQVRI